MLARFGFGEKWRGWIRACVFSGNLSVLVNGCPTEEINIQRGLKQGDPIAPFLFLLVAEGLSGVIKSAEERNLFTGFKVGNAGLSVSHLQYADDILFLGEATIDNLWTLEAILRSFELASGLKVNFAKSCVMGVKVNSNFLGMAERFLHCRVGSLPFMYLGLPVGENPRKDITWKPLLDTLAKRLNDWQNKYVSLGGRVILLNSVLNSIPIFLPIFHEDSCKVWKRTVKLQRQFLWGCTKNESKIAWVSLVNVFKPKTEGGLGIRDLRYVNLALLGKWRWRLLDVGQGIWRDIILVRYRLMDPSPYLGGRPVGLRGSIPFRGVQYPRLFQVSQQRNSKVQEMGKWENGQWVLDLVWRRELFVWEVALLEDLLGALNSCHISHAQDTWVWKHDATSTLSVKSAYTMLESTLGVSVQSSVASSHVLPKVWKSHAPSKVIVFPWQLLQDMISTRQNLFRRHVIRDLSNTSCVFCENTIESVDHLFITCELSSSVWYSVVRWLGVQFVLPRGIIGLFELFLEIGVGRRAYLGWLLIWHVVIWLIWNSRNDLIFARGTSSVDFLVERVKLFSWKWFMAKNPGILCSFYEWGVQPILCRSH
ncbi:hypothetical protein TSUD_25500 [Trifolium subterraneum]|uniref:Reverse transcriptase domain-containing protein n=1 Tax=Trifolium subterraneum TaxID=3900 RepID=A0A2Z6NC31_TRISU|nr:hypothetical protein TSUD_25500 [Trifolium subterraneum]